jgi:hypothetical protein
MAARNTLKNANANIKQLKSQTSHLTNHLQSVHFLNANQLGTTLILRLNL